MSGWMEPQKFEFGRHMSAQPKSEREKEAKREGERQGEREGEKGTNREGEKGTNREGEREGEKEGNQVRMHWKRHANPEPVLNFKEFQTKCAWHGSPSVGREAWHGSPSVA